MTNVEIKTDALAKARARVAEVQKALEMAEQELADTKIVAVLLCLRSEAYNSHAACDDERNFVLGHVFVHRMAPGDIISSGAENFVCDEHDGSVHRNWATSDPETGRRSIANDPCISGQPIGDNIYSGIDIVFTGDDAEKQAAAWLLEQHNLRMPTKIEISIFKRDVRGYCTECISSTVVDMGVPEQEVYGWPGMTGKLLLSKDGEQIKVAHATGQETHPSDFVWYPLGPDGVELELRNRVMTIDLVDKK